MSRGGEGRARRPTASKRTATPHAGVLARVLVVDADDAVRASVEATLRRLGYEVFVAADGHSGLALGLAVQPEVVLLDLHVGGLDGRAFLRRLAAAGAHSSVLVTSAHGTMDDVIDVMREGAVDFLRKPWSAIDLAAAIARAAALGRRGPPPGREAQADPPTRDRLPTLASLPLLGTSAARDEVAVPPVLEALRAAARSGRAAGEPLAGQTPAAETSALILDDEAALCASLLRVTGAGTVRQACQHLGPARIHGLVEAILLRHFFPSHDDEQARLMDQVWRHAVAQAIAMSALTGALRPDRGQPPVDPDLGYLIGLLANVGASLLISRGTAPTAVRARHAGEGAALVRRWLGDPALTAAVADHHPTGPAPASTYGCLLVVAADLIGPDPTSSGPCPQPMVSLCLAELDLDRAALGPLAAAVDDGYRAFMQAVANDRRG